MTNGERRGLRKRVSCAFTGEPGPGMALCDPGKLPAKARRARGECDGIRPFNERRTSLKASGATSIMASWRAPHPRRGEPGSGPRRAGPWPPEPPPAPPAPRRRRDTRPCCRGHPGRRERRVDRADGTVGERRRPPPGRGRHHRGGRGAGRRRAGRPQGTAEGTIRAYGLGLLDGASRYPESACQHGPRQALPAWRPAHGGRRGPHDRRPGRGRRSGQPGGGGGYRRPGLPRERLRRRRGASGQRPEGRGHRPAGRLGDRAAVRDRPPRPVRGRGCRGARARRAERAGHLARRAGCTRLGPGRRTGLGPSRAPLERTAPGARRDRPPPARGPGDRPPRRPGLRFSRSTAKPASPTTTKRRGRSRAGTTGTTSSRPRARRCWRSRTARSRESASTTSAETACG